MFEKEVVLPLIKQAIKEDVGNGDHTSLATIPETATGKAVLVAKEEGIIAGMEIAKHTKQLIPTQF